MVEREARGRSSVYALRMVESDDTETGQEGSEHRGAPDGLRGHGDCRLEGGNDPSQASRFKATTRAQTRGSRR